tara:strand:- start:432 stop:626 length:195 start_codon:yes stop_codon:yes gene_type:complete
MTRNQIIKKIGNDELALIKDKNCFIFFMRGIGVCRHYVMVPYLNDLSLDQWVDEGKSFLQEIGQ